jgi:hypothetical protein
MTHRPYGPAEGAADVFHMLLDNERPPSASRIAILNGTEGRLSDDQVRKLFERVLQPALKDYRIQGIRTESVSEDVGGAYATVVGPTGQSQWTLSGWPSPTGPVFTLDSLLRKAWTASVTTKPGEVPDWEVVRAASLAGLRRDRQALESINIHSLDYGKQGQMTWDQLEAWFTNTG